jgi:hypothetical protein
MKQAPAAMIEPIEEMLAMMSLLVAPGRPFEGGVSGGIGFLGSLRSLPVTTPQ